MILLVVLCALGLLSGFLLMTRVPRCPSMQVLPEPPTTESIAIIIPARNEEQNLPRLLESIPRIPELCEIIVVDDNSTDRTAEIATSFGALVVQPGEPPQNVTGKAWACSRGAESTKAKVLLFLDADTFFQTNGIHRMLHASCSQPRNTAISVLPFVVTERPYEELSLFFNLLMAFGAGGFGSFQPPRLFGQSLLLSHPLYESIGGHVSVGRFVLENFHMSRKLEAAGVRSRCFGGNDVLHMRMFPEGLKQLCDGWTKAFADGAQSTDMRVLSVSIVWLATLASIVLLLFVVSPHHRWLPELLYLLAVAQVLFFAREVGTFRVFTCVLFPIPLLAFFILFIRSAARRALGQRTNWRGRSV